MAGWVDTPLAVRYVIARSPKSDAQHSTTAHSSCSSPATLVKVRFMPANDASAASSPTADERTATRGAG